jgi:hypothetical protein
MHNNSFISNTFHSDDESQAGAYLDFIRSDALEQRRDEYINIKSTILLNLAASYIKLDDHHEALQAAEQVRLNIPLKSLHSTTISDDDRLWNFLNPIKTGKQNPF